MFAITPSDRSNCNLSHNGQPPPPEELIASTLTADRPGEALLKAEKSVADVTKGKKLPTINESQVTADDCDWTTLALAWVRTGDDHDFEKIVEQIGPHLIYFAESIVQDRNESEGCVLRALADIYKKAPTRFGGGSFRAYCYTFVKNHCRNLKRDRDRRTKLYVLADDSPPADSSSQNLESCADPSPTPSEALEKKDRWDELGLLIRANFKGSALEIVRLRYIHRLTFSEIAEVLNRTEPAVANEHQRIVNFLRKQKAFEL
jgi:RNA polymerase sigma factor (sigma-70 family)